MITERYTKPTRFAHAYRYLLGILLLPLLHGCFEKPTVQEVPIILSQPWIAGTSINLGNYGYEQHEFFFQGEASSFVNTQSLGSNGKWKVDYSDDTAAYKTRMLVYRPSNPANFNGTVIVEWLNVSGGIDTATEWIMMHTELLRRGYAWVGVSAQQAGVQQTDSALPNPLGLCLALKCISPIRYASLNHPGDSFSYDIFHQAALAVSEPKDTKPLGNLNVQRVIAAGQSQSAHRLVTFINAFGPYVDVFDGYFVHSRLGGGLAGLGGASAPLSQPPQADIPAPNVVRMRNDLSVPVLNVQTEGDLIAFGSVTSRQPDSSKFRSWEVAGSAHADLYVSSTGASDEGNDSAAAEVVITDSPIPFFLTCPENVNSAPQHHFVVKAAMNALNTWVKDGIPAPSFPRLMVNGSNDGFIEDSYGNVQGGVRSPYVDAPIARFSGLNSSVNNGESLCFLYGTTDMLDDATLQSLYSSNAAYVAAVTTATYNAVANGSLLPEDAQLIIQAAQAADIPPQ